MNRKQLVSLFFIALLLTILFSVFAILSPFLGPICWGIIISFAFYPIYGKLLKTTKNSGFSAGLLTFLLILALTPLLAMVFLLGIRETVHLYEGLTGFIKSGQAEVWYEKIRQMPVFRHIDSMHLSPWESLGNQVNEWVLASAGSLGNFVLKHLTMITKNVIQAFFNFFLTFFLVFFFFRDGERIYRFIYELTPLDEDNKKEIFGQVSETFSATLRGQLFTALAQATLLGIVFWVLKLPLPIFFAGFAFLASLIPVLGVASVWVPFAAWLLLTGEMGRGAALLVLGTVVISGIDNVLKPLLIGQKTKLPYSLLFLGILGGIQVYGFLGIFVAPAILSLFFVLIRIYRDRFSNDLV
jgi:predicted PurR-regulated permease PerM